MNHDLARLMGAVRSRLADVQAQANSYDELERYADFHHDPDLAEQEGGKLEHALLQAYRTMCVFLEASGLSAALADFKEEWKSYADGLSSLKHWQDEPDFPYSPGLVFLRNQLQVFEGIDADTTVEQAQVEIVRRVVKNTGHILEVAAAPPSSEADVQRALHTHLRVGFPDARREATIAQPTKSYKPDIAIDSLRTAVEVKFADSEDKAKTALGGLYEDMKGYAGDPAYTTFTAVIYMDAAYIPQDVVDAELAKVGVTKDWRIYVAVGGAASRPRKPKAPA